jgi:hypothetical protein
MMKATDAVAVMRFLEKEAHDGEHTGEARRVLMDTAQYLGHQATIGVPTGVEAEVCDLIADRQRKSITKYGMTVADNPLALRDWLQHALEEVLDQAVYLKRAINELDAAPRCEVWETFDRAEAFSNEQTTCMTLTGSALADKFEENAQVIVMKVSP